MIADVPAWILLPLLGCLIRLVCVAPTVRATWRGEGSPSLVSWSVWTATTGLGTATTFAAGASVAAAVPGAAFLQCSAMFAATVVSWWRYPGKRRRATRLDWACLGLCACTGTVWVVALLLNPGDPRTAALVATVVLCAAVATDGIASGPTWRLAWHGEEPWLLWAGAATTPMLTLLVLDGGDLATWAYPVYEITLCVGVAAMTVRRRSPAVAGATLGTGLAAGAAVLAWTTTWETLAGVVATVIFAVAVLPAAWVVFRGGLWASPITWTVWAALGVSAFVATLRLPEAGPIAVVQTAALGVSAILMAVAAVSAGWVAPTKLGKRFRLPRAPAPDEGVSWQRWVDIVCGIGAVSAFAALYFATAETVIWLTILTDFVAFIPTMVGAWRSPGDQPFWMFFWVAISTGITVIVSHVPGQLIEVIYLVYVVGQQAIMIVLILGREWWLSGPSRNWNTPTIPLRLPVHPVSPHITYDDYLRSLAGPQELPYTSKAGTAWSAR